MKDYLIKALAFDETVRIYAIRSTLMVEEAARRQGTWRTATAALGRAITAGTMMGAMLKGEEKLTVKIEGDGPASPIVVDADAKGKARAYVNNGKTDPERHPNGKLNVAAVVGSNGTLSVVKDLGMRDHFTGSVPLVSGELGEDFTYYFATSEQTPSSVALGVTVGKEDKVTAAGGFIIQMMPGVEEQSIDFLEERLKNMMPISQMIDEGNTPEEIVEKIAGKNNYQILEKMETVFECKCSKERIEKALYTLNETDLKEMMEEDGGAETTCHFCNEVYHFSEEDLGQIIERKITND